jgi:hypothetical protein
LLGFSCLPKQKTREVKNMVEEEEWEEEEGEEEEWEEEEW